MTAAIDPTVRSNQRSMARMRAAFRSVLPMWMRVAGLMSLCEAVCRW